MKTKKLYPSERDPTYDPTKFVAPEDVDLAYFPQVKRGRVLMDITEAKNLLDELCGLSQLTKPNLSPAMWEVKG